MVNAPKRRGRIFELSDAVPAPAAAPPHTLDKMFYGARSSLLQAQKLINELLTTLQGSAPGTGHPGVNVTDVTKPHAAVVAAVHEMDQLAEKWQQEARSTKESFDPTTFTRDKLFYDRPQSLDEMRQHTSFEFDRFLSDVGDDDDQAI